MSNEIDIDIGTFNLDSANDIAIADINVKVARAIQETDLPKAHGSVIPAGKRKSIAVSIKGSIIGTDYDDLRTNLDALKAALEASADQKLTTDDDRYLMVQYRNFSYSFERLRRFANFSFDLVAQYPFWLSETLTQIEKTQGVDLTNGVAFTVANAGNAPARVKITFTNNDAGAGSTISDDINVKNTTTGDEFDYRGALAAGKNLEVDDRVVDDDQIVENDNADDIANFEGDFITLNPGNNSIVITSASPGYGILIEYRPTYL